MAETFPPGAVAPFTGGCPAPDWQDAVGSEGTPVCIPGNVEVTTSTVQPATTQTSPTEVQMGIWDQVLGPATQASLGFMPGPTADVVIKVPEGIPPVLVPGVPGVPGVPSGIVGSVTQTALYALNQWLAQRGAGNTMAPAAQTTLPAPTNNSVAGMLGEIIQSGNGANGTGPSGYHLNKTGYFLKSGQYVPARTRWVRNRRMNPCNPRALSRAITRGDRFVRFARAFGMVTPKAGLKKRRRRC